MGLLAPELAPSWGPGAPKVFQKTDAKIGLNFDGFWDRFLTLLRSIFGAKTGPSWGKNGMQNRYQLREAIFQKSYSRGHGGLIFGFQGVEVGSQNRTKIDFERIPKQIPFIETILIDFGSIWGPSWPPKTEPRGAKMGSERPRRPVPYIWNRSPGGKFQKK